MQNGNKSMSVIFDKTINVTEQNVVVEKKDLIQVVVCYGYVFMFSYVLHGMNVSFILYYPYCMLISFVMSLKLVHCHIYIHMT